MIESPQEHKSISYVRIDETLCNGCVLCMKACPTKAIRVRGGGHASIEGVCIACGECIRVCPQGAIRPVITRQDDLEQRPYTFVSASGVVYAQFGEHVWPNEVLLALRRMGFRYVYDQAYTNEIFNLATELYIRRPLEEESARFPLISPNCPVVIRLIAHRFPSLLRHIPPLLTPNEIVAREAKARLSAKHGWEQEDIKVYHISPCPAQMIPIKEPLFQKKSYLDGIIGINEVYLKIKRNLQELDEDVVRHHSGGVGLGWCMSGGEIEGISANCIAVSGLRETIRYLEKIEMGLLDDMDYVEFRVCPEGCLGGPFTVADKYRAKRQVQQFIRMFGIEKRVKYGYVKKLYEEGWFFIEEKGLAERNWHSKKEISRNIERQRRVEEILSRLPRKECGVCGCPDCRTFAEDVVDGRASINDCSQLAASAREDWTDRTRPFMSSVAIKEAKD